MNLEVKIAFIQLLANVHRIRLREIRYHLLARNEERELENTEVPIDGQFQVDSAVPNDWEALLAEYRSASRKASINPRLRQWLARQRPAAFKEAHSPKIN